MESDVFSFFIRRSKTLEGGSETLLVALLGTVPFWQEGPGDSRSLSIVCASVLMGLFFPGFPFVVGALGDTVRARALDMRVRSSGAFEAVGFGTGGFLGSEALDTCRVWGSEFAYLITGEASLAGRVEMSGFCGLGVWESLRLEAFLVLTLTLPVDSAVFWGTAIFGIKYEYFNISNSVLFFLGCTFSG
jgi:hypothetical protein